MKTNIRVLIDADGCPVVDSAVSLCRDYGTECIILCDTSHVFEKENARTVVVSKGADSVDFALVNQLLPGDIAITQDYGLAAMCLAKKAVVINQDGKIYDEHNMDALLFSRHVSKKIRNSGGRLKGPAKRTKAQDSRFEQTLRRLLEEKQMNQVIEALKTRHSTRSFLDRNIPEEELKEIAACAALAPSARNKQLWKFTVVQNKKAISALAKAVGETTGNPAYDFYNPNVLIVVSAEADYSFAVQDCACALENIFVAAQAFGIGSVWINQFLGICGNETIRSALNQIHVPENHAVIGCAALGYAAEKTVRAPKRTDVIEWIK